MLLENLAYCQKEKGLEIAACCIMTSHVHLVFRTTGDFRPEQVLGDFKRHTSKILVQAIRENPRESRKEFLLKRFKAAASRKSNVNNYQFWRHDNKPIELWSNKVIKQKIEYIHENPVEEGIVFRPEDYIFSSAIDYADGMGLLKGILIAR